MSFSFLRSATLLTLLTLTAGCGDDTPTAVDTPAPQTPATPAPAPTATPAPAPVPSPDTGGLVSFFGAVDAVEAGSLDVSGRVFLVDGETQVLMRGSSVPYSSLKVGEFVLVKARQNREGVWLAREIKIRVEGPSEVKISGTVDSINPPDIMVAGRLFRTGSGTAYLGVGEPTSLADLQVGNRVTITAIEDEEGIMQALKIRVEAKS